MRKELCLALLLLTAGCQQAPKSESKQASTGDAAAANVQTATNLDNLNMSDTVEDAAYAAPGEDLAQSAGAGLIGKPAPAAVMKTIDGKEIDLSKDYGKKPVYIKFWATWCVPCRQQMPAFQKTFETMGDKVEVIALNIGLSDDEASVRKFREKYKITMPIVMDDGRFAQMFNLRVTPQHVLIGKDGRFAYFGHAENKALADALTKAVNQQASNVQVAAAAAPVDSALKVGDIVPGLSVKTSTGGDVPLKGAPGRTRAVVFFSSWCEWYLEKSRPATAKACARVRENIEGLVGQKNGVDWVGIAGGPWATAQDLADYRKNNKVSIPIGLDVGGKLFRQFGVRDIPTIVLVDATGKILRIIGPNTTDLKREIASGQSTPAAKKSA